eukprot:g4855.t1
MGRRTDSDATTPKAALYLVDGLHYREVVEWEGSNIRARKLYTLHFSRSWSAVYSIALLLNLGLAFMEKPCTAWEQCRDDSYVMAGRPPSWVPLVLEYLCALVYVADLLMCLSYMGRKLFLKSKWVRVRLVMVTLIIVNPVLTAAVPAFPRIHRLGRPFMFIERYRNVRKILSSILRSVPPILNVMVLLGFALIFFGVCFHIFFAGIDGEKCAFGFFNSSEALTKDNPNLIVCSTFSQNCKDYFATLWASVIQLFILMTTANYPDVMMPAYACGDFAAALLFVVHIIITLYFLLSLILAIVYTQFQVRTREKFDKKMAKRAIAFDKVFALLASDDLPESSAAAAAAAGVLGQDTEASHESKGGDSASGMRHRGGDRGGGGQGGGFGAGAGARGRSTRGRLRLGIHAWLDLMSYVRPDLDNRITKTLFRMVDFEGRGVLTKYQFRQLAAYSTVNATKRRRTSRLQPVSSAAVLRVNSAPSPAAAPGCPLHSASSHTRFIGRYRKMDQDIPQDWQTMDQYGFTVEYAMMTMVLGTAMTLLQYGFTLFFQTFDFN